MPHRAHRLFAPYQLPIAVTTPYTATNVRCVVTSLLGVNSTGTARLVTIYLVPLGGTAGVTNMLIPPKTILPGQEWEFLSRAKVMESGDFLQAICDAAAAVTFHGYGIETDV